MMDLVEKNGDKIDVAGLSKELGCPIVPTSALKGRGMEDVVKAAIDAAKGNKVPATQMKFDAAVEEALTKIEGVLGNKVPAAAARWYAIKLFEAEDKTITDLKLPKLTLTPSRPSANPSRTSSTTMPSPSSRPSATTPSATSSTRRSSARARV